MRNCDRWEDLCGRVGLSFEEGLAEGGGVKLYARSKLIGDLLEDGLIGDRPGQIEDDGIGDEVVEAVVDNFVALGGDGAELIVESGVVEVFMDGLLYEIKQCAFTTCGAPDVENIPRDPPEDESDGGCQWHDAELGDEFVDQDGIHHDAGDGEVGIGRAFEARLVVLQPRRAHDQHGEAFQ